jgi:CspA family cold shock protein
MAKGTVKWFNNQKGFGFIHPNEGSEEIFAHFSAIIMEGYKSLKAGQSVDFDVIPSAKGLQATNIRPQTDTTQDP